MGDEQKYISKAVIKRLPRYLRYLGDLKKKGMEKISSKALSEILGYTASQIRQDLNSFGGFGQQGYGYNIEYLYNEISKILGLSKVYRVVIVGFGRLGQAMASFIKHNEPAFNIVGIFDVRQIKDEPILEEFKDAQVLTCSSLKDFVEKNGVDIAVITVPSYKAQVVADTVYNAGIKGIWNFTAVDLELPNDVKVQNVHASDSLHILAYYMSEGEYANK